MKLSNLAIDRSTTVFVLLALIFVVGAYSYLVLPRESEPEVVIPIIIVSTGYQGVAPEDIETLVTIPIERKLTGISGVKEIDSSSHEGYSSVQIEFEPDIDIDDALQKVRDKVEMAKSDLPDAADDPFVREINISEFPIMSLCLTGEIGLAALTKIAEDLEDIIESIKGVLDVTISGDIEREIQIEVDPKRVAEFGVSLADLVTLMRVENVNTPGGALELGEAKYLMRVPGEFTKPDEIRDLVVKAGEEGIVYLRDIATIKDGFKEIQSYSRLDGTPAVTLSVSKRSGENVIFIADAVKRVAEEARKRLPPGVDLVITMDESTDIRDMVSDLENSILTGLILVLVVVFVFLGFTNAVFVALAIPVSMLITFAILHFTGVTLNMVVLYSLILALGMLVDNGIVVVENIHRHMQQGLPRVQAAKEATAEVAWPIAASTLTTVAAFSPMLFWPGTWGKFMIFLPKTVSYALLGSLFVGLVVNPALASMFMRVRKRPKRHATPLARGRLLRAYGSVLRLALRWRAVTFTLAAAALVVIAAIYTMGAKTEFIPITEPSRAYLNVDCPKGTNLDTTDAIVRQVEGSAERYRQDLDYIMANAGSRGSSWSGSGGGQSHLGRVKLDFRKLSECARLPSEIIREVRGLFGGVTGAEVRVLQRRMGMSSEDFPINIEINGEDFATLAELAQNVRRAIQDTPGLVDLDDDYDKGKPEVRVRIDREQALLTGLNTQFIGLIVKAAVNGRKAGDYREGDEEYDVTVRFPRYFREDLANVEDMNLINLNGTPIPFSSVAQLEYGAGLGQITRIDRKRVITVFADVAKGYLPTQVLAEVQRRVAEFPLPSGYTVAYTGEDEEQKEMEAFLKRAFVIALLLIALVLVTQFNSILQSLIIMTSVILSLAGVFLGLLIFDMPFGILMTGIGCISLAGIVVNNAIVLIDFINQLRHRGMPATEAIIEAAMTRFRPVMLTAITTVLGLIPMAVGISFDFRRFEWIVDSETSQWWGSMAIAVIFGLSFATVLTLVVVPTLYSASVGFTNFVHGNRSEQG